jgi:adenine-specific DNA-methyltransferase
MQTINYTRTVDLFGYNQLSTIAKMPQPQYLGAKYKLLQWIIQFIPSDIKTVLDGFAGSQSVAFEMKGLGFEVHTNDFLNFCHKVGVGLVENKNTTLEHSDLEMLFSNNTNKGKVMQNFENVFFEKEECIFLDNFRANIDLLTCKYKKALAFSVINRSLTRKTIMGHFAHTKAIDYANNPDRVKRNPSIAKSVKELFLSLVNEYNSAVFDNQQNNKSYNENILDLLPKLKNIDLAYYDPPYCNSHSDYQSFYHVLETFTENWSDKDFINGTKRYHPARHSGFDKVKDIEDSFHKLFELSKHIPFWIISYNNRSVPNIETLIKIISIYKKVKCEEKIYKNSRGGKGSVSGSKEYLLICYD